MKEADVTVHMMVRNEFPTVVFAILSVLPGCKRAIVVDTGSTDGTWEWLKKIKDLYPDKIDLHQRADIFDSTGWNFFKYNQPNRELGNLRGWMLQQTKTKYAWVVDGDEVYRNITVRQIVDQFENWPKGKKCVYVPLLWFTRNIYTLGHYRPGIYPVTGRLFSVAGLSMHGPFPGEVHVWNGQDLGPASSLVTVAEIEPFHHYEMVTKPWRRKVLETFDYSGPQPEVFEIYGKKEENVPKGKEVAYERYCSANS